MPQLKLKRFLLQNQAGMQVELCNFGARILSIKVPNRSGELIQMTLNHESDEEILADQHYMGATVGRTCNRITKSKFMLDGIEYCISQNDGVNNLHGGEDGFSNRMWQTSGTNSAGNSLLFKLISKDGDQGFPGEVSAAVLYTLNESNELKIEFSASSSKPTPINFCNHAYFTMGEKDITGLELCIRADAYLPVNDESLPLGHFNSLKDSRFDFNKPAALGERLQSGVFDHCYRATAPNMATLTSKQHRISLDILSDQVGLQFYSGNFLPIPQSALCLEAQGFPDAINHDAFEHDILRPGDTYQKYVIYRFRLA